MRLTKTAKIKEKSEYEQKVLDIARTARVVAGGRRFSFRAVVAVGNKRGKVGVGVGKGPDVSSAIEKAVYQAKKKLINVYIKNGTVVHDVYAKYASARVFLKPAKVGRGIIAGGAMRAIFDLAGIENITAKQISRTGNKLNVAGATIKALSNLKSHKIENIKTEQKPDPSAINSPNLSAR